jgi:hypothetical protein
MKPIAIFTLKSPASGNVNLTARILLSLLLTIGSLVHAESAKPNIISILCDDLGYGEVGVFYQNQHAETKNLADQQPDKTNELAEILRKARETGRTR